MRLPKCKIALIFFLIFSLITSQILPSFADTSGGKLRIAFVGIKFEDIPEDVQDVLFWRMNAILDEPSSFILTRPDAARIVYGKDKIHELLETQDVQSFLPLAKQFEFNYVFSGKLRNENQDGDSVLLVGELNRFDLATQQIQTFEVNREYDKFGNDLVEFKRQYVESLINGRQGGRNYLALLLAGGLLVAAVATISLAITGGGAGGTDDPGPIRPDNL